MKNKSSHTPGQWFIVTEQKTLTNVQTGKTTQLPEYRISAETAPICQISMSHEANARLISAAPELLETLEALLTYNAGDALDLLTLNSLKLVIAKAKGE